ncbi:MAG: hypothetical protein GQ565_05345 [Candidatus Aegiribacteria sp.]|nr:hypothetical protein [Candidatus Aegiribacteria sp.]
MFKGTRHIGLDHKQTMTPSLLVVDGQQRLTSPYEYIIKMRSRFSEQQWQEMMDIHALPVNWEHMEYEEFLEKRRPLMAKIIRRGFEALR